MKYRTFRNIVAVVAFLGMGGSCAACYGCWQHKLAEQELERRNREAQLEREKHESEERARVEAVAAVADADARRRTELAEADARRKTPGAYWSKATGLRAVDQDVIALLDRPVSDKIKDGSKGKPYKINIYSDDKAHWTRVKVDLDRDNKADESWVIKDGFLERRVSENDDEVYGTVLRLDLNQGWQKVGDPTNASTTSPASSTTNATAPSTSTAAAADGLRDVDRDMFALVTMPAQEKVKDATKGKAYKINLYSDDGQRFNRAKVDLNRNDKWDESWTFKSDGTTERQVAPSDDEHYTQVWQLASGGASWKKK